MTVSSPIFSSNTPSAGAPCIGNAQARYFDSVGKTLFGWLHRSETAPQAALGLVICAPFGYEATCSHRSVRAFADAAAAAGVAALRFDYLGTGDSAEIEPLADQLEVWATDIVAAISHLQQSTGVEKVCLLGIRLGGLLATLVSERCAAVCSLVLIAPIVSGPRYLRELRTNRLAANLNAYPSGLFASSSVASQLVNTQSQEVSGFRMSEATIAALKKIDLSAFSPPSRLRILIIDGDTLTNTRTWAESLANKDSDTKYLALPGLITMIMVSPLRAEVPHNMVSATTDWLLQIASGAPHSTASPGRADASSEPAMLQCLTLPDESPGQPFPVTERPLTIASHELLFGIVTEPQSGEQRKRGVILLNTGADYHIGANRLHVSLARAWARLGYVVLRLDLSGLGDSSTGAGCEDDDVFPETALDDIRVSIDFLRNRYRLNDVTIGGVCSGAYHALRAAASKLAINQILMVNPQNYFWEKGMRIDELQLAEVVRNPTIYLNRLFSVRAWREMLTGQVNIYKIARVYVSRALLAVESTAREIARRIGVKLKQDLGRELEEIAASGIRIVFIFARGEPGIELLKLQGGSSIQRLGDRCRVHVINGGDHIFSQRDHRAIVEEVLTAELLERISPQPQVERESVQPISAS